MSIMCEKEKDLSVFLLINEITSSIWQMALEIKHERKETPFTY
jgi:hypothetical protein